MDLEKIGKFIARKRQENLEELSRIETAQNKMKLRLGSIGAGIAGIFMCRSMTCLKCHKKTWQKKIV